MLMLVFKEGTRRFHFLQPGNRLSEARPLLLSLRAVSASSKECCSEGQKHPDRVARQQNLALDLMVYDCNLSTREPGETESEGCCGLEASHQSRLHSESLYSKK